MLFTAIVVVLAIGGLTSFSISSVRESFPTESGRITLPGLTGSVEVLRDSFGVPQIYADHAEDLFEAQGYLHAQDRFYEMDFRRHLAAGRLSELYGPSQVETDAYVRTLGWRRVAEQELPLLSPSTRRYLDAYASGVNTYLHGRSAAALSLEYSLLEAQGLRYTPEDWTPADSVSWLKVLAWQLGSNADQEAERALSTTIVGAARTASLFPSYPLDGFAPILSRGTIVGRAFDPTATRTSARPLSEALTLKELEGAGGPLRRLSRINAAIPDVLAADGLSGETGSNSWVLSGSRTASGSAILSNDPHLAASIPSVFAQAGLHCRQVATACPFDVSGFAMAAMPGVLIGKNAKIAWGMTTSYLDVEDLYLEEVRGETVRSGTTYVPLTTVTERITVRGEDTPRPLTIRSSRHGPLLSDVDPQLRRVGAGTAERTRYGVSLSWVALTPGRSMDAVFAIDQAQDFGQFRKAAALLSAPSQNLVYADTAGHIGYQLPGTVPRRGLGDGQTPAPGWDARYDWQGTVPYAELPYAYDPPGGVIVAANQPVIDRSYPHVLGSEYSYGWRSQELRDRLEQARNLTMDEAEQLFYDDTVRVATHLVPTLLKIKVTNPWVLEGQRTLVGWDYSSAAGSPAAAYFNVVFHNILKLTFCDELPKELWPRGGDRWYAVVGTLMRQPQNAWWDDKTTKQVETRDDILLAAMTNARKEITSLMARDTDGWQWGKLHRVQLRHQTLGASGIRPVEALFNRGDYPVDGGPAVVNAMAFDDTVGYRVTNAPTMRMLVDLGAPDGSRWVNQTGVSGHAFHPHYDDQTRLWAGNRLWPMVSTRAAVELRTTRRLELTPGG